MDTAALAHVLIDELEFDIPNLKVKCVTPPNILLFTSVFFDSHCVGSPIIITAITTMKECQSEDIIKEGNYVIVQKLNYKKIYRVSQTTSLSLGKEDIKMSAIIGKPIWTTFKVIPSRDVYAKHSRKRAPSELVVAEKSDSLEDLKNIVASGYDNRSINDDGKSQKLSKDDILCLRDAGKSGREIVSSLIENNATFTEKTEYAQEKYIKKKERKYCQFLRIHKPVLSSLQEIYIKQDPQKILWLRMDTLAQILSYSDVKADGTFMLYDSGTLGLVPAGMLSRIGSKTTGNLLYLHSGDHLPQMPILRAMNFPNEQQDRLTVASIFDFLKTYRNQAKFNPIVKNECTMEPDEIESEVITENKACTTTSCVKEGHIEENKHNNGISNSLKRKIPDDPQEEAPTIKKSRKVLDMERGVELISNSKSDSLVIIAKEHPLSIVEGLLPFVKASRPFVIYHVHREPLQDTYFALKQKSDVVNVRLFSNFLRSYQILPDRTHPDILTNDSGGYILTGYTVDKEIKNDSQCG